MPKIAQINNDLDILAQSLSNETLKAVIKFTGKYGVSDDKNYLIQNFVKQVKEFALEKSSSFLFHKGITEDEIIDVFMTIDSADSTLVNRIGHAYDLECGYFDSIATMKDAIKDEIILVGTQSFLRTLTLTLLKKMGKELSISISGHKDSIVDRLMNKIFDLSPQ
jgi:hypothetical protein